MGGTEVFVGEFEMIYGGDGCIKGGRRGVELKA